MQNLYEAVERAAMKRAIPRLDLWKLAARDAIEGTLEVAYPEPSGSNFIASWPEWMVGFCNAVERDNDPNSFSAPKLLRQIMVNERRFNAWLLKATKGPRGPRRGTSGFASADRSHFPAIAKMIKNGGARSPYGAALMLVNEGKIPLNGASPASVAKRVASRYRQERAKRGT